MKWSRVRDLRVKEWGVFSLPFGFEVILLTKILSKKVVMEDE